jgi:hypothetical protein
MKEIKRGRKEAKVVIRGEIRGQLSRRKTKRS